MISILESVVEAAKVAARSVRVDGMPLSASPVVLSDVRVRVSYFRGPVFVCSRTFVHRNEDGTSVVEPGGFHMDSAFRGRGLARAMHVAFLRALPAGVVLRIKAVDVGTRAWVSHYGWDNRGDLVEANAEQLRAAVLMSTTDLAGLAQRAVLASVVGRRKARAASRHRDQAWDSVPRSERRRWIRVVRRHTPLHIYAELRSVTGAGRGLADSVFLGMGCWWGQHTT